jgi:translocation and assembly module TamA
MVKFLFFCFVLSSRVFCQTPDQDSLDSETDEAVSDSQEMPPQQNEQGIPYTFSFDPIPEAEVLKALETKSSLLKLAHTPPLSLVALAKRVQKDCKTFQDVLASLGYFDSQVHFSITEKEPIQIKILLNLGTRFRIKTISFVCHDNPKAFVGMPFQAPYDLVGLKPEDFVNAQRLEEGMKKIKTYFQQRGFAFAEVDRPTGVFHSENSTVEVTYIIRVYEPTRIQNTRIEGLKKLSPDYVKNRVLWKKGQQYNQTLVTKTKRKLLETGLVGNINIKPEKINSAHEHEQDVDMVIKVKEAAPRILGAGVRYASYDGIGANAFWHHNNIGGRGEHLGLTLHRSRREHLASVNYTIADFLSPEQKLINEASYVWQLTRAYVGRTYNAGTRVDRPITDTFSVYVGGRYEIGRLKREDVVYNTKLTGIPVGAKLDKSNDALDPTSGYKVNLDVTPYYGRMRGSSGMTVSQAGLSGYLPFLQNDLGESPLVLASFARGGSIWIQETQSIPPNKRFYLGGGGSVRGYGYQLLGPLDKDRVPLGGRSFSEFGTEIRLKTTETFGFVSFLEAGSVQDGKVPHPTKDLLWGAGLGVRYYSSIAPIRFDVGVPFKRRKNASGRTVDSAFQIYISIGQAF